MNLKKLKNKKAGVPITIGLLVLATLILSGFALFSFFSFKKHEIKIYPGDFLEDIYVKEEQIRFFVNEIVDKAVYNSRDLTGSGNFLLDRFMVNFNQEIDKYAEKDNFIKEILQIKKQINKEHISYDSAGRVLILNFNVALENKRTVDEEDFFSAVYNLKILIKKDL